MSSDHLLDVGSHCSLSSCNVQDFLPIICRCQRYFCRDHIQPDLHHCPALVTVDPTELNTTPSPRCALQNCSKLALNAFVSAPASEAEAGDVVASPTVCTNCRLSFCVEHRHPKSHSCTQPSLPDATKQNEAARALLAKHFPSTSSTSTPKSKPRAKAGKIPTDPVKLAQYKKVELMKMRHRATSADPKEKATVPLDQRLFVKLQVNDQMEVNMFWIRKTLVTGRAIDILSVHARSRSAGPLAIFKVVEREEDSQEILLENDKEIASQIEDGSTVVIKERS